MPSGDPDPLRDASRGERLQRVLADAGVASRRACEEMITAGLVSVNGRIVDTLPVWVDPLTDEITVEGRRLPKPERTVWVMLNKPRRCVSTCDDPDGRRTVADLVTHPLARRLFPVGRLDYETSGLLLLTNDGDLANRLTHPRFGVEKTYLVKVKGRVEEEAVERLLRGVHLAHRRDGATVGGGAATASGARVTRRERDKTTLEITLREGRNRQVRRMLADLGHPVVRLERVRIGPLKLKGLRRGEWRELTRDELATLRRSSKPARPAPKEQGTRRQR